MTDTTRDLIQRMAKELDTWMMAHHYGGVPPEIHYAATLVAEARTALDQPEPPSRLRHCPTHGQQPENAWGCPECVREMRQQLAQPEPEGLTDEEILNLSQEHDVSYTRPGGAVIYLYPDGTDMRDDVLSFARALIAADRARWGCPAIEPVPVSKIPNEFSDRG